MLSSGLLECVNVLDTISHVESDFGIDSIQVLLMLKAMDHELLVYLNAIYNEWRETHNVLAYVCHIQALDFAVVRARYYIDELQAVLRHHNYLVETRLCNVLLEAVLEHFRGLYLL